MADLSIDRLSSSTQTKLRSTQILTSLPQIVSELFQNSLDAGAKHIEIGVNCAEWSCWVTDDGSGMSKDSLDTFRTAGRYQSSKAYTPDSLDCLSTFGFRGEALASAADLCCLEIASRTSRSRETWSIILKDGKTLYAGSAVRWRKESHGTTVCIRDAFYNLPVRRRSHPSPSRTFELIRGEIESWAIMHPEVSFSLEDSQAKLCGSAKSSMLKIPKTSSCIGVFRHLYGRALCHHVEEISLISEGMRLEGFISLDGALSKAYQFLYVNRHPIPSGDLHRIIDSKFASSSFAKNAFDEIGATQRSSTRRSPRKIEKKPVYVLNLVVSPKQIDNLLEPAKAVLQFQNKAAVVEFLSSSIVSFLVRHGFTAPRDNTSRTHEISTGSPRKRKRLDFEHNSGYAEVIPEENEQEGTNVPPAPLNLYAERPHDMNELVWTDPNTGETFIVDARTGNSRPQTQPRLAIEDLDENGQSQVLRQRRTLSLPNIGSVDKSRIGPAPEWIQEALEANDTYAITEKRIAEVTVGSVSETPQRNYLSDQQAQYQQRRHFSNLFLSGQGSGDSNIHVQHRFTKDDICAARIISQVDRKFVACVFNKDLDNGDLGKNKSSTKEDDKNSTLVLIDQHAADERIRVERFLKDLCLGFLRSYSGEEEEGVEMRHLTPPIPVLLTRHEASRLVRSQHIESSFRSWGIRFADLAQVELGLGTSTSGLDNENDSYVQVFTVCVPEVVADKLTMGNELRDLVKGYLAQLESDLPDISRNQGEHSETRANESDWLRALRWCPRELLDLVNSKACRGAIMFNDSLSREQCIRLVHQLSETVFPFQCAHGRPSLVPLANLGKLSGNGGSSLRRTVGWSTLDQQSSLE
ncbi:hypothetical protein F5890DRAFT_1533745 [Lentinula detonsa]|uniref:MutL C-terminal dimerisation domain-containing protein n=1 Tax=Lentinula detonsa TaxID=2804962 RepID=A0AA38URT6_9AGAR|nr:hypothetical protein F5890DRAFT_1533745 [Lentinula detonsa]